MPLEPISVDLPGARALFTTAATGDLGLDQTANRDGLAAMLGLQFAWPRQVHGHTVHHASQPGFLGEGDGASTDVPGVGVVVLAADCVPVVVSDGTTVTALHAGWHGLDERILVGEYGPGAAAAIGPCAGVCCYEVGDDLHARFAEYDASQGRNLNLRTIARAQLHSAGITEIVDVDICTICSGGDLYSYRRDHDAAGRQAGIGWLTS